MKPLFPIIFCLATASAPLAAQQINRYDLVGKVLVPLASVFDPKADKRVLEGALVLESASGLPAEWAGARLEVALAPPDRFVVRGLQGGKSYALGRSGQEFWVAPGAKVQEETLALPAASKKKAKAPGPMTLPFPPQNLQFLPALFEVSEAGSEGGLRLIRLRLMPMLAQKLNAGEGVAVLTIDESDPAAPRLARLRVEVGKWHVAVRVDGLKPVAAATEGVFDRPTEDVYVLKREDIARWQERIKQEFASAVSRLLR